MSGFWKVCSFLCTQYLVGSPFAWITASMRHGMEAISLWHCSGVMEAQVALIAAFRSLGTIGNKVSIFCVATIIFQHCLNPLGHGVHQSFTSCHWIPLPLLHDDITDLGDVRDLALLHLPFEDAPQITFTLSFFSKVVVVLEVCLGSLSCRNTALQLNLWREGIMLCFSMSQYIMAFMVPSMNCSSPVPAARMQPKTMTLPPTCLTVGKAHLYLYSSHGCRHTRLTPSEPNKFILVSSDDRIWFQ